MHSDGFPHRIHERRHLSSAMRSDKRKQAEERDGHAEAVRLATDGKLTAEDFDARLLGEPASVGDGAVIERNVGCSIRMLG
jgi:hypothetical protein